MAKNKDNARQTRILANNKLGNRPHNIGRTNITKNTYRYRAYDYYNILPAVLTNINKKNIFSKRMKRYLINKNDLPRLHT